MTEIVSVRLDPDVVTELRDLANQRGVTLSALLREGAIHVVDETLHPTMTIEWLGEPVVTIGNTATYSATEPDPTAAAIADLARAVRELAAAVRGGGHTWATSTNGKRCIRCGTEVDERPIMVDRMPKVDGGLWATPEQAAVIREGLARREESQ